MKILCLQLLTATWSLLLHLPAVTCFTGTNRNGMVVVVTRRNGRRQRPPRSPSLISLGSKDDPETTVPTTTLDATVRDGDEGRLERLEAILWDMDGVLADTERDAHRPAFNRVFREEGLDTDWSPETYGRYLEVGGGKERMTAYWNDVGWPKPLQDLSDEDRRDRVLGYHRRKTEVFMDCIRTGDVPLRPGVLRLVDAAIESGLTLAVCSTSNELAVRTLVQSTCYFVFVWAVCVLGLDYRRCVMTHTLQHCPVLHCFSLFCQR
jgi:beta-phosphoglucomutase-like phosphatase (HAD superfamily)